MSDPEAVEKTILWIDVEANPQSTSSFTTFTAVDAYPMPWDKVSSRFNPAFVDGLRAKQVLAVENGRPATGYAIYAWNEPVNVGPLVIHVFKGMSQPVYFSPGWDKERPSLNLDWKLSLLKVLNG